MFIKKDLRKIPKILADCAAAPEDAKELRLARRPTEFNGSFSIISNPDLASLRHLTNLSLYDCNIRSLEGIGILAPQENGSGAVGNPGCPNLRELNVGKNPIISLPDELALLGERCSLESLWCDDCKIEGPLPAPVLRMTKLKQLHMGNNRITNIPTEICSCSLADCLEVLCLDGNQLSVVPEEIKFLKKLKSLMLRQNNISSLPEGVPGRDMSKLNLLHVSSNKLSSLPQSIIACASLQTLYANGNRIVRLPEGIGSGLNALKKLNLSNNRIDFLPDDFVERFGTLDAKTGECTKDPNCIVVLCHNPVSVRIRECSKELEEMDVDDP